MAGQVEQRKGCVGDEDLEFFFYILAKVAAQPVDVNLAPPQKCDDIGVFRQRQEEMFQRHIFVVVFGSKCQGFVQAAFQIGREHGTVSFCVHVTLYMGTVLCACKGGYSLSILH